MTNFEKINEWYIKRTACDPCFWGSLGLDPPDIAHREKIARKLITRFDICPACHKAGYWHYPKCEIIEKVRGPQSTTSIHPLVSREIENYNNGIENDESDQSKSDLVKSKLIGILELIRVGNYRKAINKLRVVKTIDVSEKLVK